MIEIDIQQWLDNSDNDLSGIVNLPAGEIICTSPNALGQRAGFECRRQPSNRPAVLRGAGSGGYGAHVQTTVYVDAAGANATERQAMAVLSHPGSRIENLLIRSLSTTNRVNRGVVVRAHRAGCQDVAAQWAETYGFHVAATGSDESNANAFLLRGCVATRNDVGFYVNGGETNAGLIEFCEANGNRRGGFLDSSWLGVTWAYCAADNNDVGAEFQYRQVGVDGLDPQGGAASTSRFLFCYHEASKPFITTSSLVWVIGENAPYHVVGPANTLGFGSSSFSIGRNALKGLLCSETGNSFGSLSYSEPQTGSRLYWDFFKRQDNTGSPVWNRNTIAMVKPDAPPAWGGGAAEWLVPYGVTTEEHAAGPGRALRSTPRVDTPYQFCLRRQITIAPGQRELVSWTSSYLQEGGGFLGNLVINDPILPPSPPNLLPSWAGGPRFMHHGIERVNATTIRSLVELTYGEGPQVPVTVNVFLPGERVQ